jgi:probable phosphoglycerate mutase
MSKSNEIRVLLVRTGQTEWDRAGRMCGCTDVPLSQAGQLEAETQAAVLTDVKLSAVLCGPDEASQATALALAKATGGKIKVVEELGEVSLGLWEGRLETELEEVCPRLYRQWVEDPASVQAPEGETLEEARDRILEGLSRALNRSKSGAVGVVLRPLAHALVRCELSGTPIRGVWSMMKTGLPMQWRTVERDAFRRPSERARAGT